MGKKAAASPTPEAKEEEPKEEDLPGELLQGDFIFQDGSTYRGQYLKNGDDVLPHGEGSLQSGPEVFQGTFEKGSYKTGKYKSCNGAVYVGTFQDNVFHGIGEYSWPDGRVYSGLWKMGLMHGRGQYHNFSVGADKTFEGFSFRGKFASGRDKQIEARRSFLAEYSGDFARSATAALRDMSERAELPKTVVVPMPPAEGEEEKREAALERAAVLEVVAGPFPEPSNVQQAALQAFVALLGEDAEKPLTVSVLEDSNGGIIDGQRLRKEQLRFLGQAVEFAAAEPEAGAVRAMVLVNVSPEYDVARARWKLVHYELAPAADV